MTVLMRSSSSGITEVIVCREGGRGGGEDVRELGRVGEEERCVRKGGG